MGHRKLEALNPNQEEFLARGVVSPYAVRAYEKDLKSQRFPGKQGVLDAIQASLNEHIALEYTCCDLTIILQPGAPQPFIVTERFTAKSPYFIKMQFTTESSTSELLLVVYNSTNPQDQALIEAYLAYQVHIHSVAAEFLATAGAALQSLIIPVDTKGGEESILYSLREYRAATKHVVTTTKPAILSTKTETDKTQEIISELALQNQEIYTAFLLHLNTDLGDDYTISDIKNTLHFNNQLALSMITVTRVVAGATQSIEVVLAKRKFNTRNHLDFITELTTVCKTLPGAPQTAHEMAEYFHNRKIPILVIEPTFVATPLLTGLITKTFAEKYRRSEEKNSTRVGTTIEHVYHHLSTIIDQLKTVEYVVDVDKPRLIEILDNKRHIVILLKLLGNKNLQVILYKKEASITNLEALHYYLKSNNFTSLDFKRFLSSMKGVGQFIVIDNGNNLNPAVIHKLNKVIAELVAPVIEH